MCGKFKFNEERKPFIYSSLPSSGFENYSGTDMSLRPTKATNSIYKDYFKRDLYEI